MWPFGFGNKYPYTNFHELNLDWILDRIRGLESAMKNFMVDTKDTIIATVNKWLDDHPEATTTVQDDSLTTVKYKDGSVTLAKLADDSLEYIDRSAMSAPFKLEPHASFYDISGTVAFHTVGTVSSFQGACEYDIGGHSYLAVGVIYTDNTSGIILYQDGVLHKSIKGAYGHCNTISFCNKDNCLYVGAGGTGLTANSFKVNAVTLDDKSDLGINSHSIWYNPDDEYFYILDDTIVYKYKYGDPDPNNNKEYVFTRRSDHTEQNVTVYRNMFINTQWDSPNGITHLYVYDLSGNFICDHAIPTRSEGECVYPYNGDLYMAINGYRYDTDGTSISQFISMKMMPNDMEDTGIPSPEHYDVYFDDTATVYGDGSSASPTCSVLAALLSEAIEINISGKFVLPSYIVITKNRRFIGTDPDNDFISMFNQWNSNVYYYGLTVSEYTNTNVNIRAGKTEMSSCRIICDNFISDNKVINCYQADLSFDEVEFYNHSGTLKNIFTAQSATVNNVTIFYPKFDVVSVSGNTYSNNIFSNSYRVNIWGRATHINPKKCKILAREMASVIQETIETGSFDLNNYVLDGFRTSYANAVTLTNGPDGVTGRRLLKTYKFGTTAGMLQVLITESKIYLRTITGVSNVTFDAGGDASYSASYGSWYEFAGTAI